ncbi:prephenate dehydratase domain-containing protein [Micromonospora sp. C28SCA-DRY-2]|uniref:prephenate dehydratase n=1 Tax=Micromonospora sp. C28SCA-DRY-2 TaxID=3059522 RepID=UPI002675DC86|nr:prephenate dehydratase domain-containing protein [Micromonospora sp. C28SCA-DRY-2]MDO3702404.1 prephenate dehydratase domain-containing protein [Micromonospora sp. C28SCA-DRY-2]
MDGGIVSAGSGRTTVGFLGPEGTFTHQAARNLPGAELVPEATIGAVIAGVTQGRYDYGVVPIENTVEGIVTASLDQIVFRADPLLIRRESSVRITFDAYAAAGDAPPTAVGSHPHGLAQCTRYVAGTGLPVEHFPSTAAAVRAAAERPGLVAIGAPGLDEVYPVRVRDRAVEDHPGAYTRFVWLGRADRPEPPPPPDDAGLTWKTTVALTPSWSRPGVLAELCTQFADRGIDIVSLASRPLPGFAGRYVFVATVDQHRRSASLARAVTNLLYEGIRVKHLGSYLSDHLSAGADAQRVLQPPAGSLGLADLEALGRIFPGDVRVG